MTESEIRQIVLESKKFAYSMGEQLRDNLDNTDCALIAYLLLRDKLSYETPLEFEMSRRDEAIRWVLDIIKPIAKTVLESEIEDYKEKHDLNEGRDDCSAFKDHRDMNPENYK